MIQVLGHAVTNLAVTNLAVTSLAVTSLAVMNLAVTEMVTDMIGTVPTPHVATGIEIMIAMMEDAIVMEGEVIVIGIAILSLNLVIGTPEGGANQAAMRTAAMRAVGEIAMMTVVMAVTETTGCGEVMRGTVATGTEMGVTTVMRMTGVAAGVLAAEKASAMVEVVVIVTATAMMSGPLGVMEGDLGGGMKMMMTSCRVERAPTPQTPPPCSTPILSLPRNNHLQTIGVLLHPHPPQLLQLPVTLPCSHLRRQLQQTTSWTLIPAVLRQLPRRLRLRLHSTPLPVLQGFQWRRMESTGVQPTHLLEDSTEAANLQDLKTPWRRRRQLEV